MGTLALLMSTSRPSVAFAGISVREPSALMASLNSWTCSSVPLTSSVAMLVPLPAVIGTLSAMPRPLDYRPVVAFWTVCVKLDTDTWAPDWMAALFRIRFEVAVPTVPSMTTVEPSD